MSGRKTPCPLGMHMHTVSFFRVEEDESWRRPCQRPPTGSVAMSRPSTSRLACSCMALGIELSSWTFRRRRSLVSWVSNKLPGNDIRRLHAVHALGRCNPWCTHWGCRHAVGTSTREARHWSWVLPNCDSQHRKSPVCIRLQRWRGGRVGPGNASAAPHQNAPYGEQVSTHSVP